MEREEIGRRRDGKTISKGGQGKMEKGCCKVICGAPTTLQGYGID